MKKRIYQNTLCLLVAGALALTPSGTALALSQDETVYAKLHNDGTTNYISVNKHLINDDRDAEIVDRTILTEIENLNGFETFTTADEQVTWAANGKDIYYSGKTKRDLPVTMDVTYTLNGEEKQLEEILGESGGVEIKLKFTNHSKVGNLYTPFVAAVATTLDETKVSNVKVTNGKATSNGRSIAIAAVAAPGLYESLGLEELKNTDEVVLSYHTESFELNDIYAIVTPKLLDSADLQTFSELDDLYAKTNTLLTSSAQLVEGATSLNSGIKQLRDTVVAAKQKLQVPEAMLDKATLDTIKNQASAAAVQQVENQYQVIANSVKQQLSAPDNVLAQSLKLQAKSMCEAAGQTCTDEMINQYYAQLLAGVEKQLTDSSFELAKTTASQTAAATAETVALKIAETLQSNLGPAIVGALDSMVVGIERLSTGAERLQNGMVQFDREGVQPLANFVNGKVRTTTDKIKQLTKLAEEYDNFSGRTDNAKSETKFILMIDRERKN